MKGGFQLVNFKNLALTSGRESNIKGSFESVENANGKRTIIHNLYVGTKKYKDFTMYFELGENEYTGTATVGAETITIVIDIDDNVTVTVA